MLLSYVSSVEFGPFRVSQGSAERGRHRVGLAELDSAALWPVRSFKAQRSGSTRASQSPNRTAQTVFRGARA